MSSFDIILLAMQSLNFFTLFFFKSRMQPAAARVSTLKINKHSSELSIKFSAEIGN